MEIKKLTVSETEGLVWGSAKEEPTPKNRTYIDTVQKANEEMAKALPHGKSRDSVGSHEEVKKWQELFVDLETGAVAPMPVNFNEVWLALHLKKKKSNASFEFEAVFFPKLQYKDWFDAEKAKIKVTVYDSSLMTPK